MSQIQGTVTAIGTAMLIALGVSCGSEPRRPMRRRVLRRPQPPESQPRRCSRRPESPRAPRSHQLRSPPLRRTFVQEAARSSPREPTRLW